MVLKLEVVQTPQGVALPETSKTISEQGGSLGRGENNTWILQDPDRFLSSRHCEISCEAGQYYLVDVSTNGTFYNGAPEPLGRGSRTLLSSGDTFDVGDYRFAVSLDTAGDPFAAAAPPSDPFFSSSSPFDAPPPASEPPGFKDDFFSSPAPPMPAFGDIAQQETDPLAALEKASPSVDPFAASDPFAGQPPASGQAESFPYGQNSYGDSADPLSGAFDLPKSVPDAGLIPEDWEDDLLGPAPAAPEPAPVAPPPALEPASPPPAAVRSPQPAKPAVPQPRPRRPEPERRRDISQPNPVKAAAKPAAIAAAPAAGSSESAQTLLAAMGLDAEGLSTEHQLEIAATVGELMPLVVQGMMSVLRSRASIKNEFRMSVTTIQPVENNPLKFSADTQEALENMFVRKSKAYKGPMNAFSEGFDAIAEHQVAIIAGIRAAFASMLQQFDPQALEQQFDRQAKGVSLPGMQKARYWSQYSDHYRSVIDNMEQSFQNLFGDEFVRAYEDQLFKLMSARTKGEFDT